jgi:putative zinc finger/helix-turn-helix YgiT family protein
MNRERYCPKCEDYRDVRVEKRTETYTVRGRKIAVAVGVEVCAGCGESLSEEGGEQKILDQVYAAFREQAHLLTPSQIMGIRERYALSQKSLAALVGMSEATINRYEQGKLQDPSHDAVLRACENPAFIRERLALNGHLLSDWQRKKVEEALAAGSPDPDARFGNVIFAGPTGWITMPDEVTPRTGFRRFDFWRYAAAVVFFCKKLGAIPQTKLNKLLFYADFLNFKISTVSLTGAAYRRIQYGPVPADYDQLRSVMEGHQIVSVEEREYGDGITGLDIMAGPGADGAECPECPLTRCELAVLDRVAEEFRHATAKAISERSHRESAFQETEDRQLISYEKAMSLSLSLT